MKAFMGMRGSMEKNHDQGNRGSMKRYGISNC